jgi:hypothetical protein
MSSIDGVIIYKVREELEDFLKDDDDISKMCLTRKAELSGDAPGMLSPPCAGDPLL